MPEHSSLLFNFVTLFNNTMPEHSLLPFNLGLEQRRLQNDERNY